MERFYGHVVFVLLSILVLGISILVFGGVSKQLTLAVSRFPSGKDGPFRRRRISVSEKQTLTSADASPGRLPLPKRIAAAFADLLREYRVYGHLVKRLTQPATRKRLIVDMFLLGLIGLVFAFVSSTKPGGSDLYMTTYLPLLAVLFILCAFSEGLGSSRILMFSTCLMILCGHGLLVILYLPPGDSYFAASIDVLLNQQVGATLAALAAFPFMRWLIRDLPRKPVIGFLFAALLACYALVVVFGRNISGTRAWVVIGPIRFQITEVLRTIGLFTQGLILSDYKTSSKVRLYLSLLCLGINAVGLVVINEFGTLCVLGLVFFIQTWIYTPEIKRLICIALVIVSVSTLFLMGCRMCHTLKYPPEAETAPTETTAETTPTETPTETTVETTAETAPTETTGEGDASGSDAQSAPAASSPIIDLGARIYRKFEIRLDLFLNADEADPLGTGRQTVLARNAIYLSNWFGSTANVEIPAIYTDFIFTYALLKLGILAGIGILVILLVMFIHAMIGCLSNRSSGEGSVGVAFDLAIFIGSVISAASATGNFLIIGLPFVFLSYGGSATLLNYIMIYFVIAACGAGAEPP